MGRYFNKGRGNLPLTLTEGKSFSAPGNKWFELHGADETTPSVLRAVRKKQLHRAVDLAPVPAAVPPAPPTKPDAVKVAPAKPAPAPKAAAPAPTPVLDKKVVAEKAANEKARGRRARKETTR